ncbi:MAG: hypothetical protein NTZ09_01550, partial [Candidatus Hydrogenedentes bacterium]|nr:hypothetical protein [Candidatus Hydrogenedentota bacterium]
MTRLRQEETADGEMNVRPVLPSDRSWIASLITQHSASTRVVSRGILHDTLALPGLVAERGGVPLG